MSKTKIALSENDIKKQVKDYLTFTGWFHFHLMAGSLSYPGLPDRIAVKDGKVLFIEIKKPSGGVQSAYQKEFQRQIEAHGGEYLLIHNLDELINCLRENAGQKEDKK